MADASLVIKISATGERNLKSIRRDLDRISASAVTTSAALQAFARSYNDAWDKHLKNVKKNFTRHFDDLDRMVSMAGGTLLKGLGLALKATAAEFVLMGASMLGVHALFATGNWLMKGYRGAMALLAGAAASTAVALASVAAAIREQSAAMYAYKATGYKQFGDNLNRVRVVMRGLETDTRFASVGVENLNAAYAAVSQRSTFTAGSQGLLSGLMDFASAGQPLEQGVKAAGQLIGILQDPKASFSEITKSAEALGPAMQKAMKEAEKQGINTATELKKAINDGTLVSMGGVEGQFDAVNGTLVSIMKGGFNQIRSMFADMGQPFLKPLKEAADEILVIFKRTFMRLRGDLGKFGTGSFITSLVSMSEKLENVFVKLIRDYLPQVIGMFGRWSDKWDSFTNGWNRLLDGMRPLIDGAKVLEGVLKNIFGPVWTQIKEKFGSFNDQLKENEPQLLSFGTALGDMLVSFSKVTDKMRELFFTALPFITKMLEGVKQITDLLGTMLGSMGKIFGGKGDGFGAFGMLMGLGLIGRSMKNTKGGFVQKSMVSSMNVQANQVTVTGATAGGQMYPGAATSQQAFNTPYGPGRTVGGLGGGAGSGFLSARNGPTSNYYPPGSLGGPISHRAGVAQGMSSGQVAAYNKGTRAAAAAQAPMTSSGMTGLPSRLQQFSGSRGPRAMRNNSKMYGNFSKYNNSASGKMGTMVGLGLLSSVMPEETQGAMSLGASLAVINPALGLGVAGIGTAMTSKNAAVGVGGGVVGGAALGMMVAGPVGAAVGGILGGVLGGIKANSNKHNAMREEAREQGRSASKQILEGLMTGISDASKNDDIKAFTSENLGETLGLNLLDDAVKDSFDFQKQNGLRSHEQRQALVEKLYAQRDVLGFEMSEEEKKKALEKPNEFLETINKELAPTFEAATEITNKFESRMDLFTSSLRMTEEEVMRLAQATGVNLYDAAQNTGDMIKQLADGLITSKEKMDQAMADIGARGMSKLSVEKRRLEAPHVMDEAAQNILDMSRSGNFDTANAVGLTEDIYGGLIDFYEGDTTKAMLTFLDQFADGKAFEEGNTLSAMKPADIATFLAAIQPALDEMQSGRDKIGFDLFSGIFADSGLSVVLKDPEYFSKLTDKQLIAFGDKFTAENIKDKSGIELKDMLAELFPDMQAKFEVVEDIIAGAALDLETKSAEFVAALTGMITALSNGLSNLNIPDPPAPVPDTGVDPDTSTPRGDTLSSRYSRTMSAHSQLDSMASGKRFVTSGWRNFDLGSPSSDHVNGRAYDLTGQNLGAYKSLVDASGGFGEFHGSAGSRHLHVVPNTSGGAPMGDSSSPATLGGGGGGGMTNNNNYTININGSDQSPEQIAEAVMQRIKSDEMSMSERR